MKIKSLIKHNLMRAAMTLALILACATAWADNVLTYYIDENGTRHDVNATELRGTGTLTADQWYVVNDNVTFSSGRIYSTGNIKLILADGKTFTISSNDTEGIIRTIYGTVSIYGQEDGTGTLNVTANGSSGNAIYGDSGVNIVGGHITATSNGGAGIQSGGNITISGGQVSATGGSGNYGLRTFYTITLGWRNPTDYVYASSYNESGTVKVKDGQAFKDNSGNIYVGTLVKNQINGKTLTPATQTEYIQYCLGTGNDGSAEHPYTINDANGWSAFCLALDDKDTWNGFSGKTVKLGANIAVSRMAGSDHLDFAGTFDGNRKTLTFNYTTTESIDRVAPFSYITNNTPEGSTTPSPAVIRNLDVVVNITTGGQYAGGIVGEAWGQLTIEHCTVSGTITTSNKYAGGIIGHVSNTTLNITDCRSSVTIISSVDGDGTHGGIAASMANSSSIALNISGCVFDGKLLTTIGTTDCGGFVGWRSNGSLNISNSLYAPATIADDETEVLPDDVGNNPSATFARNWTMPANSNNYYTRTLGTLQGKQRLSITAGNYVTVANAGTATVYATSGITTYGTGIKYDDVLYAGDGDAVSLTLTNTPPEGYVFNGYTVSPEGTTLTGSGNAYTLTMPNEDVTIVADLFYCPAPTLTLEDNSITAYGATVSWTGSSESYILEYAEGNSPSTWITVSSAAESPYTFSDLTPATTYSVRVTGNCGNVNSQPSDVVSFTTDCGDFIVVDAAHPFTEGFEGEDFPPRCWESIATDDYAWSRKEFYYDNRFCAYSGYFGSIYLVMPDIQLPSQGTAQLTFWSSYTYLSTYSNQGKSSVVLRSGGTETELWVLNITGLENYYWYETTIDLTDYMGQTISLAFKYEGNNAHGWYVDDVEVTATASIFTKDIEGYENDESGWYLIASPIGTVDLTNVPHLFDNQYDLYYFDQTGGENGKEWKNHKAHTDTFTTFASGQGYLYANSGIITLEFTGAPYNGNGEVAITNVTGDPLSGWNLVGNPFAVSATLSQPYYRMNDEGSALNTETEETEVAAMEGVFVQATEAYQSVTFTPQPAQTRGSEQSAVEALNICLGTAGTSILDNAILRFDGGQTLEKFSFREGSTKLYIPQNGKEYAIVNAETQTGEIPVNFKAESNGTYTLNFTGNVISSEAKKSIFTYLHLIDNLTGADIDLLTPPACGHPLLEGEVQPAPSYTFTAKTTDYESRFRLVFSTEGDGPSTGSGTFAFISDGNIIVNGEGMLQVVDVMGRIMMQEENATSISTSGMTPGVYVLRLINGENVRTQKIVIK